MPQHPHVPARIVPRRRTRMPRPKPSALTGTAELNAMIERVAPDILTLLADGVPRRKPAIVEALADRHDKQDVTSTLIRLTITERVRETGGKYTLGLPTIWHWKNYTQG